MPALSTAEWGVVLDALDAEPNPEGFDFGPAYEAAVRERSAVAAKLRAALLKRSKT